MTVKNNRELIFFFDESCSLCLKAIKILKVLDLFSCIEFKSVQSFGDLEGELTGITIDDMLFDGYSIDYDGNILK